jgi:iron complex outermembrane recepter protein
MIMRITLLVAPFVFGYASGVCQQSADSVRLLDPYTVTGYLYNRPLSESPASLGIISSSELERFTNTTFLPAINAIPGVRMEERSPASYRLSIRGSAIRSPFGVRNVKVYWNNLPFTDGGGNTYLNLFDYSSVDRIEIIKGPGGSLYGAGTGGVMILNSSARKKSGIEVSSLFGSYGLKRYQIRGDLVGNRLSASINVSRLGSDGYRDQSGVLRDVGNIELSYSLAATTTISVVGLYSDIFYETPGGLTLEQFDQNPTQARPAAGMFRSAVAQNANVKNTTAFGGLTFHHEWSKKFLTDLGVCFSNSDFRNFAIANYEKRDESNYGVRMENAILVHAGSVKGKMTFGGEFQSMNSPINVYENNEGVAGALLIADELKSNQTTAFVQAELDLPHQIFITAGSSESWINYDFARRFPDQASEEKRFDAVFSPRIALLKKIGKFSVYTSASKGFSPPTLAEVRPSTNVFNANLFPEKGINYEVGVRAQLGKFNFDLTQYFFRLRETIVLDRVENGAEYFVNAGKTNQRGTELTLSWSPLKELKTWGSLSYSHYRFVDYGDFSGNEITGVPATTAVAGVDANLSFGLYFNTTFTHTDEIPLNDANEFYADDYFLVATRVGFRKTFDNRYTIDTFFAVDNLFDEKYSLGNDLNARGMRFYNAAPGTNYSAGIKFLVVK